MQLRKNCVAKAYAGDVEAVSKEKAFEVLKKQGEIQMNLAPM